MPALHAGGSRASLRFAFWFRLAVVTSLLATLTAPAHAAPVADANCASGISRFWQQLDAVCQKRAALVSPADPNGAAMKAAAPFVNDAVAYCNSGVQPVFAAASFAERSATLRDIAAAAGLTREQLGEDIAAAVPADPAGAALDAIARRIVSDEALATGALGDLAVHELTASVCKTDDVRNTLVETCSPPKGGGALLELRRRLIKDVAALVRHAVEHRVGQLVDERTQALLAKLTAVEALLDEAPLASLARKLAADAQLVAKDFSCSLPSGGLGRPPQSIEIAAAIVQRIAFDGSPFDQGVEHYVRVIDQVLRAYGKDPLGPEKRRAAETLIRSLGSIRSLEQKPRDLDTLRVLAVQLVESVDALITLLGQSAENASHEVRALALALVEGQLTSAADIAASIARVAGVVSASQATIDAMLMAAKLSVARDEDEARRILRRLIVPLGPWSEPILFDINGDVPKLGRDETNIVGDATLGYNARSWGIVGTGALREYDLSSGQTLAQTSVRDGTLETWLTLEPRPELRLEFRLTVRAAYYDTTNIYLAPGSNQTLADETSFLGKGMLLASARYQSSRFAAGLWLGGGGQYESYTRLEVGAPGARRFGLLDQESSTGIVTGRLRVQYAIWPSILASRIRVDAQRFTITRDGVSTTGVAGRITTSTPAESATQTEVQARFFLDAEVARFASFVPSLNAGFDYFALESTSANRSTLVPVIGIGVRRETF